MNAKTSETDLRASSTGRHPRDLARLLGAAGVVALACVAALARPVYALEVDIFRLISHLPEWSRPVLGVIDLAGSLGAIAAFAAAAFFARRVRLGAKLVAAGALAWGLTRVVEHLVPPRPTAGVLAVAHGAFTFPAQHVAIAAAMATCATPYLARPLRRLTWPTVALVALAAVGVGHHFPLDALTGAFLGWWSGSLLHLLAGAPGRRTSPETVRMAMDRAGLAPTEVTPRSTLWGPTRFAVRTRSGQALEAEVVRRGQRRAGWWYQARRFIASLEVQDEPRLTTPTHEVEHEAFVTLLAERAGVRTPKVVLAQELGHGAALLIREGVAARSVDTLPRQDVDDAVLRRIWRQVATLGDAGIAHHDLQASNLAVGEDGEAWILDFTFARAGASSDRLAQDVAEVLVTLASVTDTARAVDSAVATLDLERLHAAQGYLHALALPSSIRQQSGEQRQMLEDLRLLLAERLGCQPPTFRTRVRPRTVLVLAVGGAAVYLLLPQIGTVPRLLQAVRHANYWWLVAAAAAGTVTFPMASASYLGAVRRTLPYGRTTAVQVASAFTSRLTPGGLGGMGLNLIYLEREGLAWGEAAGSIAVNQTAGAVVHATLFFLAAAFLGVGGLVGGLVHHVDLPGGWLVLAAVVVVLAGAGAFLGSPLGRRRVVRPGLKVGKDVVGVLRQPRKAAALFGGSAGVTLGNGFALVGTLVAFHARISVLPVLAVYVGGSALASAAPTPGNLGAVEAALVAGLTGIGIAAAPAVAAVLTFRLLTFWLPIVPGLAMFRLLQHRGVV